MSARELRLATLICSRRGSATVPRWELLKPGREALLEAVEVLRQLGCGVPDSEDYARLADELLGVVRDLSPPPGSTASPPRARAMQRKEQALPPSDRVLAGSEVGHEFA